MVLFLLFVCVRPRRRDRRRRRRRRKRDCRERARARARAVVIMDVDASKRVAIVTGANTGIGRETALGLAKAGMKVFLACRNADKAREAATYIRQVVLPISLSLSLSLSLSHTHTHTCTMSFLPTPCVQCGKALKLENSEIPLRTNVKGKFH